MSQNQHFLDPYGDGGESYKEANEPHRYSANWGRPKWLIRVLSLIFATRVVQKSGLVRKKHFLGHTLELVIRGLSGYARWLN